MNLHMVSNDSLRMHEPKHCGVAVPYEVGFCQVSYTPVGCCLGHQCQHQTSILFKLKALGFK